MTIKFCCPSGHQLTAPDHQAGQEVHCPLCQHSAIVPELVAGNASGEHTDADGSQVVEPQIGTSGQHPAELPGAEPRRSPPPLPAKPLARQRPTALKPRRPPRRTLFPRSGRVMPPDVYQPDQGKIQTVRWLALLLAMVVAFSTAPAVMHLNLPASPGWVRAVLLLAALQAVYLVWMLATPDWSTVWVMMLVFAFVAALYGTATAIAVATPLDKAMPLGMGEVRTSSARWCGSMMLLNALATYLCGRTSAKWRRSFELEMAARARPRHIRRGA